MRIPKPFKTNCLNDLRKQYPRQEYFGSVARPPPRRCVTIADARLVSIAERWTELPHTLKRKLERLCLQYSGKNA